MPDSELKTFLTNIRIVVYTRMYILCNTDISSKSYSFLYFLDLLKLILLTNLEIAIIFEYNWNQRNIIYAEDSREFLAFCEFLTTEFISSAI